RGDDRYPATSGSAAPSPTGPRCDRHSGSSVIRARPESRGLAAPIAEDRQKKAARSRAASSQFRTKLAELLLTAWRNALLDITSGQLQLERVPVLENIDCLLELDVLFLLFLVSLLGLGGLVRRLTGRRAGTGRRRGRPALAVFVRLPVLEVMRQVALVNLRVLVHFSSRNFKRRQGRFRGLHVNVGRDAYRLNRAPIGSEVARGGEAKGGMIVEREDGLNRAFAEGLGADHDRAALVLQGARHDLAGARSPALHQYDQRVVVNPRLLGREELLFLVLPTTQGVHDHAAVEEFIRNFHRLLEQAAGIVAQVQDQTLDVTFVFLLEVVE